MFCSFLSMSVFSTISLVSVPGTTGTKIDSSFVISGSPALIYLRRQKTTYLFSLNRKISIRFDTCRDNVTRIFCLENMRKYLQFKGNDKNYFFGSSLHFNIILFFFWMFTLRYARRIICIPVDHRCSLFDTSGKYTPSCWPVLWNRNRNFLPCGTGTVTCQKVGTGMVINYGSGTAIKWFN